MIVYIYARRGILNGRPHPEKGVFQAAASFVTARRLGAERVPPSVSPSAFESGARVLCRRTRRSAFGDLYVADGIAAVRVATAYGVPQEQ